jgi:hypothetical protein
MKVHNLGKRQVKPTAINMEDQLNAGRKRRTSQRQIHNINRYVIVVLVVIGLWLDGNGFSISDLFFGVATLLWLFIRECDFIEAKIVELATTNDEQ